MSIKLSDSIRVGQQKPLEDKYFNELVPYTSTSQVNTLLPKAVRHIGLTVNINKEEYWYKDGIEDANLVLKVSNTDALILKNQEQDDRLENLEGENAAQNDLINDLFSDLESERTRNDIQDSALNNLEGIITITYNHSQKTGNPHDTELEELTDVSGDDTTIVDTDVILKKDTGGFWRKITFANFKNWFTTELAKKINIGSDTVFNFKNISAMTLTNFRSITPNIETIYFTEEQNATGWQQVRYNGLGISIPATTETLVSLTNENFIELDSDSTFNLINVQNTKINGIFEKDFVIIKFNAGVVTPATANQWFKVILKINGVQTAVSPVFYLTETSGTVEQIAHNFALNVPTEMVTNGATLHLKTSTNLTFNNPAITVVRVHKSTNANL